MTDVIEDEPDAVVDQTGEAGERRERRWRIAFLVGLVAVSLPIVLFAWLHSIEHDVDRAAPFPLVVAALTWPVGLPMLLASTWRAIVHRMDRFMDEHP